MFHLCSQKKRYFSITISLQVIVKFVRVSATKTWGIVIHLRSCLTSAVDGCEWSISCPLALTRGRRSRYSQNESWLDSRVGPDVWEERTIFRPCRESNSLRSPRPHPNHYIDLAIPTSPFFCCFLSKNKCYSTKKICNYRTGSVRVNLKPSRSCWEPASASTSEVTSCEKHLCLYLCS